MPGEFFFLTFGGLGISLAGFAGLIFVLGESGARESPIAKWRIRHIATTGLFLAQAGLLVFPTFFLTDSVESTVRIVTAVGLMMQVRLSVPDLRPGPAWPDENRRRAVIVLAGATFVLWIANLWFASVGFLMLLFVLWLSAGIGTFMNAILELRTDDGGATPELS